jgi:hypothetical protein
MTMVAPRPRPIDRRPGRPAPLVDKPRGGWLTEMEPKMMILKLKAELRRWCWHTIALACAPGS